MQLQSISSNRSASLPTLSDLIRRPTALIWAGAVVATGVVAVTVRVPELLPMSIAGALVIAVMLALGDLAAIELEDGSQLSPASALLVAGIAITSWPLLIAAVIVGTLIPALARRRLRAALSAAGGRVLAVALIAPIDALTHLPDELPYSTLGGMLGLVAIGAVAYLVEIGVGIQSADEPLLPRWRARLRAMRWYVLAMILIGGMLGHLWRVGALAFLPGLVMLVITQHLFRGHEALHRATRQLETLAEQHRERGARLERLQSLATAMIGTLDIREMLEILCVRLAALLNAPYGWVVLLDKGDKLRLMACHNLDINVEEPQAFVNPESYTALLKLGRVVLVTNEHRHDLTPLAAIHESVLWSTVLSIPLVAEKRVLGVICLAFEQLRGLDAEEQRVLAAFAHQAAVTLDNARLFDELRHKQVELIQSSKLAAVGTFAAGIAHEFNNLLGSMLGYAELGHSADDIEEKEHALDVVIQACRRGRSITRGLLTFARRQENHRTLADVTDAINETLTLVELDLRKSRITVVRQIEIVPYTVCDIGQLAQVVLNLVTNARDAMKPDGGTLTIGLRERQNMIELSVSDTGCGIPPELLDKIFEPFITTKGALGGSQTPGTGLGLSVSYGIVKEHNGTITVESTVGVGTTMTVHLPIVEEPVERELPA